MIIIGDFDRQYLENLARKKQAGHFNQIDVASYSRSIDHLMTNLNKPRKKTDSKPHDQPCKASGVDLDTSKAGGMLHAVGHHLTGRCIDLQFKNNLDVIGRYIKTEAGQDVVMVQENMAWDGIIRTFLHELGHCEAINSRGDDSEAAANGLRRAWLDWAGKRGANEPCWILKVLLDYPSGY